jgi:hypothetical protein
MTRSWTPPDGRTAAETTADNEKAVLYADVRKMLTEALDWELGFGADDKARGAARWSVTGRPFAL